MAIMNRRELIQKMSAGAAVVAVSVTVPPHALEAAPLSAGKTLPPHAIDEFVHEIWHRRWHRVRRRRRRRWACWWHRGRRVCAWRWY
jgi:hypothetical protein